MSTIICPVCKGAGNVKIGWFRNKVCFECKGSGYVNKSATPVRKTTQSNSHKDDGSPALDFTSSDNLSAYTVSTSVSRQEDALTRHGGSFGGAGAGGHFGDSQGSSNCSNDSSSPPCDSSSSSCSSDSGSGGGGCGD